MSKPIYRSLFLLAISGATILASTSCKEEQKVISPLKVEFKKEGELTLYKSTSDSIISTFDIEIAEDDYETQTGLMSRHSMLDKQAMLFIFPDIRMRSFYMKNTLIPLDIIYLDANGVIVSFQKNAKPLDETSLPSEAPAKYVLEINGGLCEQWNINVGDRMEFSKN